MNTPSKERNDLEETRWCHVLVNPTTTLWQRDKTYLLIFVVVNIIAGQVGVLTSLLLTWQAGGKLHNAWEQTLSSGALYTFSISLVVSILAVIGSELIDAIRFENKVHNFEQKVAWSILAGAILVLQAPLVGAILSKPADDPPKQMVAKIAEVAGSSSVTEAESSANPRTKPSDATSEVRQSAQVVFWILSMAVALQLYCLYRIPFIPDSYARQRNEEVRTLTEKAEHKSKTPFDEQI